MQFIQSLPIIAKKYLLSSKKITSFDNISEKHPLFSQYDGTKPADDFHPLKIAHTFKKRHSVQ
jgi:hypothetical protein